MKTCSKCKIEKDNSGFYKNKTIKDGLSSSCRDCSKEYQKEYRRTHKEHIKKHQKEYRLNNIEKLRKYNKEYGKGYFKEYRKKRRLIDPQFRLNDNISSLMYISLKGKKAGRRWEDLVGYTSEDLIKHLESKFQPWMTWDNWGIGKGKWNIDHIKPISLFNYTCPEDKEFKECWALDNLQPLEAIENIKKYNKY
jgi:hypothetical protein